MVEYEYRTNEFDKEEPCKKCGRECDHWDAMYCCTLCRWLGADHCDSCDYIDI